MAAALKRPAPHCPEDAPAAAEGEATLADLSPGARPAKQQHVASVPALEQPATQAVAAAVAARATQSMQTGSEGTYCHLPLAGKALAGGATGAPLQPALSAVQQQQQTVVMLAAQQVAAAGAMMQNQLVQQQLQAAAAAAALNGGQWGPLAQQQGLGFGFMPIGANFTGMLPYMLGPMNQQHLSMLLLQQQQQSGLGLAQSYSLNQPSCSQMTAGAAQTNNQEVSSRPQQLAGMQLMAPQMLTTTASQPPVAQVTAPVPATATASPSPASAATAVVPSPSPPSPAAIQVQQQALLLQKQQALLLQQQQQQQTAAALWRMQQQQPAALIAAQAAVAVNTGALLQGTNMMLFRAPTTTGSSEHRALALARYREKRHVSPATLSCCHKIA